MRAGQKSLALLVFLLALVCPREAEAGTTQRVSVNNELLQKYLPTEGRSFIKPFRKIFSTAIA